MNTGWFDISVPVRRGMVVFEGDPAISVELIQSRASGGVCNVSRIVAGVHTGTHIDAPVHFIEGGDGAELTPLDTLIGPVHIADATGVHHHIDAATVEALGIPAGTERLIFKTPNSALWSQSEFSREFFALTADAAEALVHLGVRLVGIDYLSIAPFDDPAPTHVTLLEAGVVILEGLDLGGVEPGPYTLVCLPLLLEGADGAPARALLAPE
ncbi:MAG: cyclase family protein [Chloroflexi bacterium]|nr:cyclase family protein [Chloroflexota bacterium]